MSKPTSSRKIPCVFRADRNFIDRIDRAARKKDLTRSAFIIAALREYLTPRLKGDPR